MTSEARVLANRRNAEKSTGPRTPEGKAVVAQNAIKHGLLARQAVLKDEDPAEFELHRQRMLDRLAPDGPEEEAMAQRIVALWWRLKRAERIQDEALDYLMEADGCDSWTQHLRSKGDPSASDDLRFGRVVARDFAKERTLDRLMMYEQRIESALYRTRNELHRLQLMRKAGGGQCCRETPISRVAPPNSFDGADSAEPDHPILHGQTSLPVPPGDCAKQSQSEEMSSLKCEVSSGAGSPATDDPACETKPMDPAGTACSVPVRASGETQDLASLQEGVITSGTCCAKQSQSSGSAPGARTIPRAVRRVAWHYHNAARSC